MPVLNFMPWHSKKSTKNICFIFYQQLSHRQVLEVGKEEFGNEVGETPALEAVDVISLQQVIVLG